MKRHDYRFSHRLPDHVSIEMAHALINHKGPVGFNDLFDKTFEVLKRKNLVSGGEEMLRLRAYEKLQLMVTRGLVRKTGKEYESTSGLSKEYPREPKPPEGKPAAKKPAPEKAAGKATGKATERPLKDRLFDAAMDAARSKGATSPTEAVSSDGGLVIVDTDSGDCYRIEITAKKIKGK